MKWNEQISVRKGDLGEQIVNCYLESKGFVIYRPITSAAHCFDKLAIKDKRILIIAEIKTKARRNYYPDTGFNLKHFYEYKYISKKYNIPVFIFFVDEMIGKIYGNWLKKLEQKIIIRYKEKQLSYPLIRNKIIYFPLKQMKKIAELKNNEIEQLKQLNKRNYNYIIY